jgi:hypothetical protein
LLLPLLHAAYIMHVLMTAAAFQMTGGRLQQTNFPHTATLHLAILLASTQLLLELDASYISSSKLSMYYMALEVCHQ